MSDIETNEVDVDEFDIEESDDGSFLATAAVIGAGALLGFIAAKGYDKAKSVIEVKLANRRARKILEEMERNETDADEAE